MQALQVSAGVYHKLGTIGANHRFSEAAHWLPGSSLADAEWCMLLQP
jgi:hypothetical protein